jgi:hypothetical protein
MHTGDTDLQALMETPMGKDGKCMSAQSALSAETPKVRVLDFISKSLKKEIETYIR